MYINTLYVYVIVLSVSYYFILIVYLCYEGDGSRATASLIGCKNTKKNRDKGSFEV